MPLTNNSMCYHALLHAQRGCKLLSPGPRLSLCQGRPPGLFDWPCCSVLAEVQAHYPCACHSFDMLFLCGIRVTRHWTLAWLTVTDQRGRLA